MISNFSAVCAAVTALFLLPSTRRTSSLLHGPCRSFFCCADLCPECLLPLGRDYRHDHD